MIGHQRTTSRVFYWRFSASMLIVTSIALAASADVVILKDGFIIQGNVRREMESVRDPSSGKGISVPKGNGLDYIDDGPRLIIFSSHNKQLGEISKDIKIRPEYKAYTRPIGDRRSNHPFLGFGGAKSTPDFNDKWKRTLDVYIPGGFDRIEQQITYLDPYCCYVVSPTHLWSQTFRTFEMDPKKIRKYLSTHPELVEVPGKPDPIKRIAIARFMLDAGWLYLAKEEIAELKKLVPELPKDAQELLDRLQRDIDIAVAGLVVTEAEFAAGAGRYKYAAEVMKVFTEKTADPKELERFAKLKAHVDTTLEQYAQGKHLLTQLLDEISGGQSARLFVAFGGGPGIAIWPNKTLETRMSALFAAAETVLEELHPDSSRRIETFINLAAQASREKAAGKPLTKTNEELLATLVSGWCKGAASEKPDAALAVWKAREAALAYQRGESRNERSNVLASIKRAAPVGIDEFAQIISLLPPGEPENLKARTGTLLKDGNGVPERIYRRRSASYGSHPTGVDYLVRLPPEYHHGRAYPVLIVLTYPGLDAERLLGAIASEADQHGYIMIAPLWCEAFGAKQGWEWKGDDHDFVTGTLRDVVRHFTVDNDRVFMAGAGSGADMAMDIGVSHPDLFAGVVAMGPVPKWQGLFIDYWQNAQKLPFYIVTGDQAMAANSPLRLVFERWMPNGFPALHIIYRGRGIEWFSSEVPVFFEWMSRKKRANTVSTLATGNRRFKWQTNRENDNRFYWLGAEKIDPRNLAINHAPGRTVIPAQFQGDIKPNNSIQVDTQGVRLVSIWLGQFMIDWTKPVSVTLNGSRPNNWKPKILEPDLGVLLEDYWERGDRRMLYLAKLEFPSLN